MKSLFLAILMSLIGISVPAQSDISGTWNTGDQNTLVEIEQQDGIYIGKIISSDNPKVKQGKVILKDFKPKKDSWTGKIYAPRRGEWHDVGISISGNKMKLEMSVGFFSKTIEWIKHKQQ